MSFNPTGSPFTAAPKPFQQPMQPPMLPGMPPPVSQSPFQPMPAFPPAAGFQQAPPAMPQLGPNFAPPAFQQPPVADMFNATQAPPQMPGAPATQMMDPSAAATTSLADTSGSSEGFMSSTLGKVVTAAVVGIPLIWGGERVINNKGILGFLIRPTETAVKDLAEDAKKELGKLSDTVKGHFEAAKKLTDHKDLKEVETKKEAVDKLFNDSKGALKTAKQSLPEGQKKAYDEYQDALKGFFDGKLKALKDKKSFEKEAELTKAVEAKHTAYETAFTEILEKTVTPLKELHADVKAHFAQLDDNVISHRHTAKRNKKEHIEAVKTAQTEINQHFTNVNNALNKHRVKLEDGPANAYQKYVDTHTSFLNDTLEEFGKGTELDATKVKAHKDAMRNAKEQFKKEFAPVFPEAAEAATPKKEPAVVTKPFSKLNDEAKTFITELHDKAAATTEKIKGLTSEDEIKKSKAELKAAFDAGNSHIDETSKTAFEALKKAHMDYHDAKLKSLTDKTDFDHDAHHAEITKAHEAYEKNFAPLLHQKMEEQTQHSMAELGKATRAHNEAVAKSYIASQVYAQALGKSIELEKEFGQKSEALVAAREKYEEARIEAGDRQSDLGDAKSWNKAAAAKELAPAERALESAEKKLKAAKSEFSALERKQEAAKAELKQAEEAKTQAKEHEANAGLALAQRQDDYEADELGKQKLAKLLPPAS